MAASASSPDRSPGGAALTDDAGRGATGNAADPVFDHAADSPSRAAARRRAGGQWVTVTAAELAGEVCDLARGLLGAGVRPGDRLAIMSRTTYEWTLLDFAALSIGAVVVPIYETSSAAQVQWILADSGAVALVVENAGHAAVARDVLDATSVTRLWQVDDGGLDEIRAQGSSVDRAEVDRARGRVRDSDLATIIYTSGTTGRPKGAKITHGNLLAEIEFVRTEMHGLFNPDNSTLLFLPLAHVFGRVIAIAAISTGCVLGHVPDTKALLEDLAAFQPTFVLAVPRVFEKVYNGAQQKAQAKGALTAAIFARAEKVAVAWSKASMAPKAGRGRPGPALRAQHALFDALVYRKLRAALGGRCTTAISGGAALGQRLGHFFHGVGLTVVEGYGMTETTAAVVANRPDRVAIGTVGTVIPQAQMRISDAGEILLRGRVVFAGYWRNDEATAAAFDEDGWFHTGDLGVIDADGNLTLTGRSKEILVTAAGKNVAPAPLEDLVRAHWLVGQAMVVGDGRPFIGALITIDPESWPLWLQRCGADPDTPVSALVEDAQLRAEIQTAIDVANLSVSRAESIREFRILGQDWTEAGGQITPSLKLRRSVVMAEHAADVEAIYSGPKQD